MSKGIKITKQNQDVDTADVQDFYVNTDTPLFKLYKSGNGKITRTNIGQTVIIPHDLGYVPATLVFAERSPGIARMIATSFDGTKNFPNELLVHSEITKSSLSIVFDDGGVAGQIGLDYAYTYFIFYDKLDEDE